MCPTRFFCLLNLRIYLIYLCCYLLIMVAAGSRVVNGLKCYCNPKECDVISAPDCPGKGVMIWDPCKCCRICAKTLGETCGGPGDFSGQCEPPLQCVAKLPVSSGVGVCMELPFASSSTTFRSPKCPNDETIPIAPGCEITNKRCQCWPHLHVCPNDELPSGNMEAIAPTSSNTRWHFKTLEDCQLNLQNLIRTEMEFDEDYTIPPSTTFTYKKLRRKRRSMRKRMKLFRSEQ